MFGRLAQAVLAVCDRAHFAGQPEFPEDHEIAWQGARAEARQRRRKQGEVGTGLGNPYAADDVGEDVLVGEGDPAVPVHHGQVHGETLRVQADGHASRIAALDIVDQGLDLHEQRPRSLPGHRDDAPRRNVARPLEEDRGRVADLLHAVLGHGEYAEFVHRPESVLLAAQRAIAAAGGRIEHHQAVDHVFQDLGSGQVAFLGDMPHQHDGDPAVLGQAHEFGG